MTARKRIDAFAGIVQNVCIKKWMFWKLLLKTEFIYSIIFSHIFVNINRMTNRVYLPKNSFHAEFAMELWSKERSFL